MPGVSAHLQCCVRPDLSVGLGATAQTNRPVPISPRDDFAPLHDIDQLSGGHVGGNGSHEVHVPAPLGPTDDAGDVGWTDRAIGEPMLSKRTDCRLGPGAEAFAVGLIPPWSAALAQSAFGCTYPLTGEPQALGIPGTFRRGHRASGRHQLVD